MAGIYIHVPYCKTRCVYCDFFTQTNTSSKGSYVTAIAEELKIRKNYIGKDPIKTIYFGGGTPSQLSFEEFRYIFEAINHNFAVVPEAEITMEANPDDLSSDYLSNLTRLPFNRLSIGIQSFNDDELKYLKRRHSAQKAVDAVMNCKRHGFDNISMDLMYGLPNQTLEIWESNLQKAIELDIEHISSYHLIYEEGTKLYRLFQSGGVNTVSEDTSLEMFSTMINMLSVAEFEHYEISNFARRGLYSQHNSSYWLGQKYLGLGPAAHSYDGTNRAWNVSSISRYIKGIETKSPAIEIEELNLYTRYNDFILTGMRTVWGVNLSKLESTFGRSLLDYCLFNAQKHIDIGVVIRQNNVLKLTRQGIFVSDDVMSDLMYV